MKKKIDGINLIFFTFRYKKLAFAFVLLINNIATFLNLSMIKYRKGESFH